MKKTDNSPMLHRKGDGIRTLTGGYFRCICADEEIAVFAKSNKTGTRINHTKLHSVSNVDTSPNLPIYTKVQNILKPKYMNDQFTWKQVLEAINRAEQYEIL